MLRTGDEHRVDVLHIEQPSVVREGLSLFTGLLQAGVKIGLVNVGDANEFYSLGLMGFHHVPSSAAGANDPHQDLVIGAQYAVGGGKDSGRDEGPKASRR